MPFPPQLQPSPQLQSSSQLQDAQGRTLRDLRISVTDRCNFRCRYCMPREAFEGQSFLPKDSICRFEEIQRVAAAFVARGVQKIRLTGGEPLLRRDLPHLVSLLAKLDVDLAMTTNGVLLPRYASSLKRAGLRRLTISLDALDEDRFQRMSDAPGWTVTDVLAGIEAAERAGFESVKVNCVVRRGVNEDQVVPLCRQFMGSKHVLRFIEYMDVGTTNGWQHEQVVSARELRSAFRQLGEVRRLPATRVGEVSRRYLLESAAGALELGVISSVSEPFCGNCGRVRLSADGRLYTCLFAQQGYDILSRLRGGMSDEQLSSEIEALWSVRSDRYSELRAEGAQHRRLPLLRRVEMSYIGG